MNPKTRTRRILGGSLLGLGGAAWLACSSSTAIVEVDSGVDATTERDSAVATDAGDGGRPREAGGDTGCVNDPGAGDAGILLDAGEDGGDPVGDAAAFGLVQAMAGFPEAAGALTARIETELGFIVCRLDEKAAPVSVANFVGLARGTRPFMKDGIWTVGKFYDGLIWHRVIPDFVIQGGDPRGNGTGGPGFALPNENHVPQVEGVLSMAASNPTPTEFLPSGSQFYLVVGKGPKADYNVFGTCSLEVARAIAEVPRSTRDKPKTAVHMKVAIERCPN